VAEDGHEQRVNKAAGVARGHQVRGFDADDPDPQDRGDPFLQQIMVGRGQTSEYYSGVELTVTRAGFSADSRLEAKLVASS
jgi:hypothetical protein